MYYTMETTLFHRQDKPAKPLSTKPLKELTAVTTPNEFISSGKRMDLVQSIQDLSALNLQTFEQMGKSLIHALINYCQLLPETANSYYALAGGIVDFALNRTEAALRLFNQYLILNESNEPSEIQQLWLYALLSASLLQDIGKLQIDYQVQPFNSKGEAFAVWNPIHQSLHLAGHYYQFSFEADHPEKTALRQRLNLILAQLLMPKEGFDWIASDPEVLAAWLALLSDDWQSAGTLGAILIRANAIAIQRYFDEHLIQHVSKQAKPQARVGTFIVNPQEENVAKDQLIGVEFIKWLTKELGAGRMLINKNPLLMVPAGLLIMPETFKLFIQHSPVYKNWQTVQRGFLSLGLHRNNANGGPLSRYEQNNTHQMHEGVLFEKYAIALPQSVKMQNIYTGKVAALSALELVHLAQYNHAFTEHGNGATPHPMHHLSASGKWEIALPTIGTKPGKHIGG